MKVQEIMSTGVECVGPDTSLKEAAAKMKSLDVGFLPICDGDKVTGTLTDRDIAIRAVAEGRDVSTTRARDVMTTEVFYCYDDEDVEKCASYMQEKEVRRLLILNRDKRLVGVVSIGDVSKAQGHQKTAGETLKDITEAA